MRLIPRVSAEMQYCMESRHCRRFVDASLSGFTQGCPASLAIIFTPRCATFLASFAVTQYQPLDPLKLTDSCTSPHSTDARDFNELERIYGTAP
jgi:hypothetical protein